MLTADQKYICDEILSKLLDDKDDTTEIIISGAAGTGKTYLLNYFINETMPSYFAAMKVLGIDNPKYSNGIYVCATTNKAVQVLEEEINTGYDRISTIESLLGLIVKNNFKTGETKLTPNGYSGPRTIVDAIIIIDECSMINYELYEWIKKLCVGCFIIYVGDQYQLPAVKGGNIPLIFQKGFPIYTLNAQIRNDTSATLMKLCNDTRQSVITGLFSLLDIDNKDSFVVCNQDMQKIILNGVALGAWGDCKIVTYTNNMAILYNNYVMQQKYSDEDSLHIGEHYIANSPLANTNIKAEDSLILEKVIGKTTQNHCTIDIDFIAVDVKHLRSGNKYHTFIAADHYQVKEARKIAAKNKDWVTYFFLSESILDMRPTFASTIHKAQGSTYDTIIIDAEDFKSCTNPAIAARLIYVAVSRARKKVIFFNNLPKKYGDYRYVEAIE